MNVLHNICYGMYVVSSFRGEYLNGQIANTVFQITNTPVTIAVSINKQNLTHEYIAESGYFAVSVLREDTPLSFIGLFGFKSGRTEDKFRDIEFKKLESGCPVVLQHSLGYLEAKVRADFDCGTHTLFLGELGQSEMLGEGKPMTYEYYHKVKRGTTPKSAPTYIKDDTIQQGGAVMQKYRCVVCNYVYDPAQGDPDNGVAAGTQFESLPDTWVCPVCGADKSQFEKV